MRRSVEANESGMDVWRAIDSIDDVEEDEIDDQGVTYNWYLMATCRRKKQTVGARVWMQHFYAEPCVRGSKRLKRIHSILSSQTPDPVSGH